MILTTPSAETIRTPSSILPNKSCTAAVLVLAAEERMALASASILALLTSFVGCVFRRSVLGVFQASSSRFPWQSFLVLRDGFIQVIPGSDRDPGYRRGFAFNRYRGFPRKRPARLIQVTIRPGRVSPGTQPREDPRAAISAPGFSLLIVVMLEGRPPSRGRVRRGLGARASSPGSVISKRSLSHATHQSAGVVPFGSAVLVAVLRGEAASVRSSCNGVRRNVNP